jgi:hypothetical protein
LAVSTSDGERLSLEEMRAFLKGNQEVGFQASNRKQTYEWTQRTLCTQKYSNLPRHDKGLAKKYTGKVTRLSRAQITRLVAQYVATGTLQSRQGRGRRYTARAATFRRQRSGGNKKRRGNSQAHGLGPHCLRAR